MMIILEYRGWFKRIEISESIAYIGRLQIDMLPEPPRKFLPSDGIADQTLSIKSITFSPTGGYSSLLPVWRSE